MGWSVLQVSLLSIWCCVSFAILLPREDVELAVPLSGNLSNTSTHFDPTTWTLFNPIFNQTTWEAQPYVWNRGELIDVRCRMGILVIEFRRKGWDTGKLPMRL